MMVQPEIGGIILRQAQYDITRCEISGIKNQLKLNQNLTPSSALSMFNLDCNWFTNLFINLIPIEEWVRSSVSSGKSNPVVGIFKIALVHHFFLEWI